MADEAKPEVDLNKLVDLYVKLRDKKKEMEDGHKAQLLPIVQGIERLEAFFHNKLNELKVESMNTVAGTFFKKKTVSITVANRETFLPFIKENDLWDLADVRAAKKNIEEYMDKPDPSGEIDPTTEKPKTLGLPPGLNYRAEIEVQVRRS